MDKNEKIIFLIAERDKCKLQLSLTSDDEVFLRAKLFNSYFYILSQIRLHSNKDLIEARKSSELKKKYRQLQDTEKQKGVKENKTGFLGMLILLHMLKHQSFLAIGLYCLNSSDLEILTIYEMTKAKHVR